MRAVFLASAEEDLKELRRYLINSFGRSALQESFRQIKDSVQTIQAVPFSGSIADELADLGLLQYRHIISGMNRIIYEVRDETIYIHVVCDTRRYMRTLLSRRLLRAGK